MITLTKPPSAALCRNSALCVVAGEADELRLAGLLDCLDRLLHLLALRPFQALFDRMIAEAWTKKRST